MTLPGKYLPKPEPNECEWCGKLFTPRAANLKLRLDAKFCNKTCQNQFQKHHKGFNPR